MNYNQFLDRFVNWAQTQADIVGAIIVGSQARTNPPADQWSDLDLVMINPDGCGEWTFDYSPYLGALSGNFIHYQVYLVGGSDIWLSTPMKIQFN